MNNRTEYVVSRNRDDELIVLELLWSDGVSYINKVFSGSYKAGKKQFFTSDIRTASRRQVFVFLFEKV